MIVVLADYVFLPSCKQSRRKDFFRAWTPDERDVTHLKNEPVLEKGNGEILEVEYQEQISRGGDWVNCSLMPEKFKGGLLC